MEILVLPTPPPSYHPHPTPHVVFLWNEPVSVSEYFSSLLGDEGKTEGNDLVIEI